MDLCASCGRSPGYRRLFTFGGFCFNYCQELSADLTIQSHSILFKNLDLGLQGSNPDCFMEYGSFCRIKMVLFY